MCRCGPGIRRLHRFHVRHKQCSSFEEYADIVASLQAYAYCGCYFNMPGEMAECANVQLDILEDVEPVSSVSLLPFSATITTTLYGPVGPTISVPSATGSGSVISFGGVPTVVTTTVYATSVYTTTVGGSASPVTTVAASTGVTTSYATSAPPTMLPPPPLSYSSQSTSTSLSTFESTEVYTTTNSAGSLITVTTSMPATRTIYSCAGGCESLPAATATETVCVRRKQTRVFRRDEI